MTILATCDRALASAGAFEPDLAARENRAGAAVRAAVGTHPGPSFELASINQLRQKIGASRYSRTS